jgi:hypothetical protein
MITAAIILLFACKKDEPISSKDDKFITPERSSASFGSNRDSILIAVNQNVESIDLSVSDWAVDWCRVSIADNILKIIVSSNSNDISRNAMVTLSSGKIKASVMVQQAAYHVETSSLSNDIKLTVASATASEAQGDGAIQKSYDGLMNTLYHSRWRGATVFPVTLTYNFSAVTEMDYLVYHPRPDGGNGRFKAFELYVAQNGGLLTKYGDYDFNGSSSPSRITFDPPLQNPTSIRFVVQSGTGDADGDYVSCAEMEFYRRDTNRFDYTLIFTDASCSQLKANVTQAMINNIGSSFFKDLANRLFHNDYESEFRVQTYRAWANPDLDAAMYKTNPYSQLDNPTGIYVAANKDLVALVDDTHSQNISLAIIDLSTGGFGTRSSYFLQKGENKIKTTNKGLIYVMYHTTEPDNASAVKINIVTGQVNGYFDRTKHTAADWTRLLAKAVYADFDLVGKYAHLTFPTTQFRANTPDGKALIEAWDTLVYFEHELMGMHKHNKKYRNRVYCHQDYNPTAALMYATSYHTAYSIGTVAKLLTYSLFTTSEIWGPAHEIGHVNQVRPGMKWLGMTEVTTNIYSLYVQTKFGNPSRLIGKTYSDGLENVVNKNEAGQNVTHNQIGDLFVQLVPFWQLYLYFQEAGKRTDFYQDLFEHYRTTPNYTMPGNTTDGRFQLDFVRNVCNISQTNMLDFFQKWGFLSPIDIEVNDYGTARFTITQEQINALKSEIVSKSYPTPAKDVTRINDNNVGEYR